MPDDVELGDGDAVDEGVGVSVAEPLAEGDALVDAATLGVGVGLVADAAVQPARTMAIALVAQRTAARLGMGVQRETLPLSCVPTRGLLQCALGI